MGRGRGGGKAPSSNHSQKQQNGDCEGEPKRKRLRKVEVDTEEWGWEDWSAEWDQHWWDEYEQGEWDGWNVAPKKWDEAAWHDGKAVLHEIAENNHEGAEPTTRTTNKDGKQETAKNKRKGQDASKEHGKKTDKTIEDESKAKKAKHGKNDGVNPVSRSQGDIVTEKNLIDEMVEFATEFNGLEGTTPKEEIKALLNTSIETGKDCSFNRYWTRNAVGVKSLAAGRDIAYFRFAAGFEWPVEMALALKAAESLAPFTH